MCNQDLISSFGFLIELNILLSEQKQCIVTSNNKESLHIFGKLLYYWDFKEIELLKNL